MVCGDGSGIAIVRYDKRRQVADSSDGRREMTAIRQAACEREGVPIHDRVVNPDFSHV